MTDTGGAAFPGPSFTQGGHPNGHSMGMTKREYFAGQAMAAMIAGYWSNSDMTGLGPHEFSVAGVEYADALIAALAARTSGTGVGE